MSRSRIFAWVVVAATAALIVALIPSEGDSLPTFGAFLFWAGLLAAVELLPMSLGFETNLTMGFPILLAMAILFNPLSAMFMAGAGAVDPREFSGQIPLHRALFNRAQTMLAVGAATLPLTLSGSPFAPLPIAGAAILHLLTNLGLVAFVVHFDRDVNVGAAFRKLLPTPLGGFVVSYVLLTGLGVATAQVYDNLEHGEWAVTAIVVPLVFARLSLLGARAQQELSEKVRDQQRALLEATERVFREREDERNRIAEEIHDGSLQMLAAAAYGCGNASEFIDAGRHDLARDAAITARDAINGAITALRDSLVDLRRSSVEEGGLVATIVTFADHLSVLWGTQVNIEADLDQEPPIPVALAAFQILQEGLTNALKHSDGGIVTVRVSDDDGLVHIVVEDEGVGFDPDEEVGAEHVGMRLMHERANKVGGRIELDSAPGRGTRLEAILPGAIGG